MSKNICFLRGEHIDAILPVRRNPVVKNTSMKVCRYVCYKYISIESEPERCKINCTGLL